MGAKQEKNGVYVENPYSKSDRERGRERKKTALN